MLALLMIDAYRETVNWQGGTPEQATCEIDRTIRGAYGRSCMLNAMASLHTAGEEKLSLVVTVADTPAYRLYESLGFVPE
jgi:hypothetical protein